MANRFSVGFIGLACLVMGCDDRPAAGPVPLMAVTELPVPTQMQAERIAQLEPGQSTQLVATAGAIYVLQSDESGTVRQIEGGKAVPTRLTVQAIAASMSLPQARGRIVSIAADGDRIAFCFAGVNGTAPVVSIGTFNPANGEIFTTVDSFSIQTLDPELLTTSVTPFLYVEGDQAWLVRVEKASLRILKIRKLRALQPEVSLERVDLGSIQDAITRSAWDFSSTAIPGTFYLTDTASRWIRTVDDDGTVRHVARFDDSISAISPASFDAAGRVIVLASGRDGINRTLLVQNNDAFKPLPVAGLSTGGIDVESLRIDRLVRLPEGRNRFLAYDGTSGAVLRIALK